MENGTKHRILYLYQHLLQHTDAEHPLSTAELIKILKEQYTVKVSRNTISDDLATLHDCGLHIEHYESTQNKYYYDGHAYDLAELKLLTDAISSSRFITRRKSDELITKLLTLTSAANATKLRRHAYVSGRVKSDNEQGYYIVDVIHEAIDTRRKIQLIYADYDVNKKRYITNGGVPYTVSPYTLEWDGDYYYLRGFCDERQAVRTFRIDRVAEQPKILNQIAVSPPEDYSPAQYSKCVFRMFDTDQPEEVQLQCHISTMKYLIDNFGMDVKMEPIGEDSFRANVLVCASSTFYRWIFGFNGKIKILGPEAVKTAYREMLQKALYEE
ncbi:helix-turn-helix transcriptional regulator [Stomatobaculum longum]|uniref:helix-turn-helix transcriptional regulator n=1 Tax=Stomatobaculum longum TaxID=796942 RepID=UPI0028E43803|nr:WYL domain-containing protein [Stomatobaculum longum]